MSEASEILQYLIDPNKPKVKQYETLAGELSEIAGRPFTWRYILSVLNETVGTGEEFIRALRAYVLSLDDTPLIYGKALSVTVRSDDRDIEGAYIMGKAKVCPECGNKFVGSVPWRKFCPACRPPVTRA